MGLVIRCKVVSDFFNHYVHPRQGYQMKIVKSSEWLISENKNGGEKFWRLHIVKDGANYYTQTEWYQISKTGRETKRQTSEPYFAAPTNVGRANERNSQEQADFEYDAVIKKQRDKGFRAKGERKDVRPMPMLAHKFSDHKGKVEFPVYVQPKLNGMRMLFDGENGWSRGNKEVIPEVIQHLKFDAGGFILDGELMLPNNVLLQESMTAIKKYRPELSPNLLYHVYDIVDSELPYAKRQQIIHDILHDAPPNVVRVPTWEAFNEADVLVWHKSFTRDGFEGTMIRNPDMQYEIGKRSYSLLKLKDFIDDEYRIVDIIDGDGSDKNLAIFILETDDGQHFNCRPEGSQENRRELYKNRSKLIGLYVTVRYQELSRDGIPIFPVGVGIRELGDF
jgi:DNA ligase-1